MRQNLAGQNNQNQYALPAGQVTAPVTTPGGGAGIQAMQAPAVQGQQQGNAAQSVGGLLGVLGKDDNALAKGLAAMGVSQGTLGMLGGVGQGMAQGSVLGPIGSIAGGIVGGIGGK